jgi:hypothetical protein
MNWVFIEVFMAWSRSIDIFPRSGIIEAQFVWRDAYNWAILRSRLEIDLRVVNDDDY